MIDIPTFRIYAKIAYYAYCNYPHGVIPQDKLRDLIGTEFNLMAPPAIDRHFQNMIIAHFFTASLSGMKASLIDWNEFEEMLKRKTKELNEKEGREP